MTGSTKRSRAESRRRQSVRFWIGALVALSMLAAQAGLSMAEDQEIDQTSIEEVEEPEESEEEELTEEVEETQETEEPDTRSSKSSSSGDFTIQSHTDPAGPPSGNGVQPERLDGNQRCPGLQIRDIGAGSLVNGAQFTSADGLLTVTISNVVQEQGDKLFFDWSSNIPVDAVLVKAGEFTNQFSYVPPVTSDSLLHAAVNESNPNHKLFGISHVDFCYSISEPDPTGSLEVEKVVDGDGEPASGTKFTIVVDCDGEEFDATFVFDENGDLIAAESDDNPITDIPLGTDCTVTETDDGGADEVTYNPHGTTESDPPTVTIEEEGETVTVTVTNTFDEVIDDRTGSIDVTKAVVGTVPDGTEFEVTVDCDTMDEPVVLTFTSPGDLGPKSVEDIELPAECDVEETSADVTPDDVAYAVGGGSPSGTPPTVNLSSETTSVSILVTNTYEENGDPDGGILTIQKVTIPDDATQEFSFSGDLGPFDLGHGGTKSEPVSAGTHSVTEGGVEGWTLTDITCELEGEVADPTYTPNLNTGNVSVEVGEGEHVICTFTNVEDEVGDIIIDRDGDDRVLPGVTDRDALALTGASLVMMLLFALALIAGGTLTRYAGRRRNEA